MNVRRGIAPMAWIAGVTGVIAAVLIIVMNSPLSRVFDGAGAGANRGVYIWDLCVGRDDLWVVYPTNAFEREAFGIYSHGKEERGEEVRPYIEGFPVWDPAEERF